jgi:hypothetical protein
MTAFYYKYSPYCPRGINFFNQTVPMRLLRRFTPRNDRQLSLVRLISITNSHNGAVIASEAKQSQTPSTNSDSRGFHCDPEKREKQSHDPKSDFE